MTQSAKRQRKPAPRRKKAAGARAAKPQLRKGARTAVTAAVDPLPAELPLDVHQGLVVVEAPPPEKPAAKKKAYPSARCALVASAFQTATSGAVRRQLKGKTALALVLLVPGATWIEAVRTLFVERFGAAWEVIATDAWNNTPKHKTERAIEVAAHLARGRSVVGVAAHLDALPSVLTTAADLTIRISAPNSATIVRAIRMFAGAKPPGGIDETLASGLDFHDLVAAFRKGSTPTEIVERLRKAASALRGTGPGERLPPLEDAVEYGAARLWGLNLARDIADFRAGRIGWEAVDRGAVLYSEPGLGKSLFARILARACGVPLVAFSVADLFANSPGYLDSVIKQSRSMFQRAAVLASPCSILFLDEIDAIGNRATMGGNRGQEFWTSFLTDFILSVDAAAGTGTVILAATNRIAAVDAAILRPGRLERVIELSRPEHAGIVNILRHHLDDHLLDADLTDVGHLLAGSTPADIMLIVRGARRTARYAGRDLALDDLLQAIAPNDEEIPPDALTRICVHESGHCIGALAIAAGRLHRCMIGSTSDSLGCTIVEPEKEDLLTRNSVERRAVLLLCGRAAEELLLGDIALGAGGDEDSDLAQVTKSVAALHASAGLGETLAYLVSYDDALTAVRSDRSLRAQVEQHMQALQARAAEVVRLHRDAVVAVAAQLRIRRRLSGDEIQKIFDAAAPQVPTNP